MNGELEDRERGTGHGRRYRRYRRYPRTALPSSYPAIPRRSRLSASSVGSWLPTSVHVAARSALMSLANLTVEDALQEL